MRSASGTEKQNLKNRAGLKMEKAKKIRKCPECNQTEVVCGTCGMYVKSSTFTDYGVCVNDCFVKVAKESGYRCDCWVCSDCGYCLDEEGDLE